MTLQDVLTLLDKCVSFNTTNPPGNEESLANYLGSFLSDRGFDIAYQRKRDGHANVIAKFGHGNTCLIFTGHLDVVPAGKGWTTEPFKLTQKDNRLYGRGTADMKAAVVCMIAAAVNAVKRAELVNVKDFELVLLFVSDEEINGWGTRRFLESFSSKGKTMVVIGEPTDLNICVGHRGVVRLRVDMFGRQCHSSQPEKSNNVLYRMAEFVLKLEEENQRKKFVKNDILPPPTLAVTRMNAGVQDNIIPGFCSCLIDFRTIPGETRDSLCHNVADILSDMSLDQITYKIIPQIEVFPSVAKENSEIKRYAAQAYEKVFHEKPVITFLRGCCDMSFFRKAGLDTVICGPGSLKQAHTADEYIEIKELDRAMRFYEELISQCRNSARSE